MTGPGDVHNQFSGVNAGNVVQTGSVSGGVHFHQVAPQSRPGDRQRLLAALRVLTVPVTVADEPRTAFAVAPGRLVTFGTDLVFLDRAVSSHPCLCEAVEPGDELWALGFPKGGEATAEVVGLRCPAVIGEHSRPQPLDLQWGTPGAGSTGGPVLNWRTGAVCGLMLVTESGVWLVPATMIERAGPAVSSADRAWLELLDDDQLRASGQRYPGVLLRTYLAEVGQVGEGHPYRPMVKQGPSLTEFYLPQHLHHESDGTHRISVDVLAERHEGAQVLGDPGVGKSSLVRHLAAESAGRWLTDGIGAFVPIPVSARALSAAGSLPRLLADGVTREIVTVVDTPALTGMFEREPMPGVPWLVLVDGLDEVLSEFDRRLVLDRVLSQRDRSTYRFLVTSRPLGSGTFTQLARKFPTYVVEPFNDEELARFAKAWFEEAGYHDAGELVEVFTSEIARSGLGRLARVPLVSMMLCIVFVSDREEGLPRSQHAVYERFFAVLARKLEASGTREQFRDRVASFGADAQRAVAQLVTELPKLLEQIALARQGVRHGEYPDTRPVLTQAVTRSLPGKPAVIPDDTWTELVAEALRASGLLVHRRDDFRFLHQTIEEYLAAKHLAASASKAERRAMLAPQTAWPWPHLEIKIFVVALWTTTGIDVAPQLARLLKRRHRDTNAGFVVELARRGVQLPDRVRAQVCEVLVERMHSDRALFQNWLESVRWLGDLEPERAVEELERLARTQVAHDRAIDAVLELAGFDQDRGVALARWLIEAPETSPGNRFKLAKYLFGIDHQLGLSMFTELARRPDMGVLTVEAAIQVADADPVHGNDLLGWLATAHRSGTVCLAAGRALLNREPDIGIAVLDRMWYRMSVDLSLRLELTGEIAQISAEAAEWRYVELTNNQKIESSVRFAAAKELSRLDLEQCVHAMTLLVHADEVSSEVRVDAAVYLADDLGQGTDALLLLARKLIPVVLADETNTHDRLAGAKTLIKLRHGTDIMPALEKIADNTRTSGQQRMTAAALLDELDPARALAAYVAIADDARESAKTRIAAADVVRLRDTDEALRLYLRICAAGGSHPMVRIEAGAKAGEIDKNAGITALADLVRTGTLGSHYTERIARAMLDIDQPMTIQVWRTLRRYPGANGALRAASRAIPDHDPR